MLYLLLARAGLAHVPVVYITRPTEDWCAVGVEVSPGEENAQ